MYPITPPVSPMLAKLARDLPASGGKLGDLLYEPKWDGFRAIIFRDGDDVEIGSRNEKPLTRYFPDLVEPLQANLPARCVVDGEIVIATERGLDFDRLSLRIHPAKSRVAMLAEETPAAFVAFDLLAEDDTDLRERPFRERRERLVAALATAQSPVFLTPATTDRDTAGDWFERFEGAGLDGVVAKPLDGPYEEGKRTMLKVKHLRTADCVVAGFRFHKDGNGVGSLLLGLFDATGVLHHVGVASSFSASAREELLADLEPHREGGLDGHPWREWAEADAGSVGEGATAEGQRRPGAQSRWNAGKDLSWEPLRVELVAEVAYEHLQGDRFRHTARFQRWRPDRTPESCTYEQLDAPVPMELQDIFGV
jgi:ATP-dependent DNA ligase